MKKTLIIWIMTLFIFSSCKKEVRNENPFLNKTYNTPFEVPPFEKIRTAHFMPAYLKGFEEQKDEIRAIISNPDEPTFENTVRALDYCGELLTRVSRVFSSLHSANTNDTMQAINKEIAPLISKHRDDINFNDSLFRRVKVVYENMNKETLTQEDKKLIDDTYNGFIRSGANLSPLEKEKLRRINEELSVLSVRFGENQLGEINGFRLIIDNKEDLAGLPEGVIAQASSLAKSMNLEGKWVFTLQVPSMTPFLQYSDKRDLREKLYTAYFMRGDNDNQRDNKEIISRIVRLRLERSSLLGFKTYADFALDRNMAKTPEKVFEFLNQVFEAALPVARAEVLEQQNIIDREGGKFKLAPWDWWYYTEKIKKEKYDLDDEITRPYFQIDNVISGMFYVANQLYNLEFSTRDDIPKYHPDVKTYEVAREGKHIGILLIDNYPRASKRNGAWCGAYRGQSRDINGKMVTPVVTMVTNSTPPAAGKPSLLTSEEASTLFHEFGHALHQLLSNSTYPGITGTNVPRDFVELPSQIMEHWVVEPEVLKVYAKHYETGEVIPAEIIEKLDKTGKFNMGFNTVEYVAASLLDMEYHTLAEPVDLNIRDFEKRVLDKYKLIPEIKPRYRSTYFQHIFSGGYAAGYYSYLWSEVLDCDAFLAFRETGDIFNKEVAAKFEKEILSKGGTRDPLEMYLAFRGKEPGIDAMLVHRGLK